MELLGNPESSALRIKNLGQNTGSYLDSLIQDLARSRAGFDRKLTPFEQAALRTAILQTDPTDPQSGLVSIFAFREAAMLDQLLLSRGFELDMESYPKAKAENISRMANEEKAILEQSMAFAIVGNIEGAIRTHTYDLMIESNLMRIRNRGYAGKLAAYFREARRLGKPTRVFIRIGEGHDALFVQRSLYLGRLAQTDITAEYDFGQPMPSVRDQLLQILEIDPQAEIVREQVLQSLVGAFIEGHLYLTRRTRPEIYFATAEVLEKTKIREIEELMRSMTPSDYERTIGQFLSGKLS